MYELILDIHVFCLTHSGNITFIKLKLVNKVNSFSLHYYFDEKEIDKKTGSATWQILSYQVNFFLFML